MLASRNSRNFCRKCSATAEGSSSWTLGEYAVSIRSDLRSAAEQGATAEGSSSWTLGEYAASIRSDLRSAAELYAATLWRGEIEERVRDAIVAVGAEDDESPVF